MLTYATFHLGPHCLPKYVFTGIQNERINKFIFIPILDSSGENLSSGFVTSLGAIQSSQLQGLARVLNFAGSKLLYFCKSKYRVNTCTAKFE